MIFLFSLLPPPHHRFIFPDVLLLCPFKAFIKESKESDSLVDWWPNGIFSDIDFKMEK